MANTPEVDQYLTATNNLLQTTISISGNPTIDQDTFAMMRQIQTALTAFLTALQRLPPVAPPAPPETQT